MHLGIRSAALTLLEPPQFRIGIAKSALGRKDSNMRISIEGVVSQLMNQGFKSAVGRRRGADSTPKCKGSNPLHLQRVTYEGRSKPRGTATFRRYELVSVCGIWRWRRHMCPGKPRVQRARRYNRAPAHDRSGCPVRYACRCRCANCRRVQNRRRVSIRRSIPEQWANRPRERLPTSGA